MRGLLERHGFRFSKSMGQNFLVDPNVPERIAENAGISADTHVLEIGPGIGALTKKLCVRAGFVTAVELDRALLPILNETLADYPNHEIISGDALAIDMPRLMARIPGYGRFAVCANLPYNITAPLLSKLLECGIFESVTVMVQREVARRMAAEPGWPDYSAFTVYIRYHAEPKKLFDVPPGCFIPAPKVVSSVVRLLPAPPPPEVQDEKAFFGVVRAAFAHRRKTLANTLLPVAGGRTKEELTMEILACGIDPQARGETLGISEFARLASALSKVE